MCHLVSPQFHQFLAFLCYQFLTLLWSDSILRPLLGSCARAGSSVAGAHCELGHIVEDEDCGRQPEPQAVSFCFLSLVLGINNHSSQVGYRFLTALLLVSLAFKSAKRLVFPVSAPRMAVPNVVQTPHSPGRISKPM